jgi:hypothetical protein
LGSAGGGLTGTVTLSEIEPNWADGQWHQVKIALSKIYEAKAQDGVKAFDKTKASQFMVGSWAGVERKVDLWFRDVTFTATEADAAK